MTTNQQPHHHLNPAEQAAMGFVAVTLLTASFSWLKRKRWLRGQLLATPALLFLGLWAAGVLWVFVTGIPHEGDVNAFELTVVLAIGGTAVAVAAYLVWLVLLCLWECVVWLTHTDAELTRNRRGHWVTAGECHANKVTLEAQLRQWAPTLVMDALLAGVGDGYLLGIDTANLYATVGQPWQWWNHASQVIAGGGQVWRDDPPGDSGFARVTAPVIALWVIGWLLAGWVAAMVDIRSGAGRAALIVGTLILSGVIFRRRLRRSILAMRQGSGGQVAGPGSASSDIARTD